MVTTLTGDSITITGPSGSNNTVINSREIKTTHGANTSLISARQIQTRGIRHPSATSNNITLDSTAQARIHKPQKGIIQVVNTIANTQVTIGTSAAEMIYAEITPTYNDSEILVEWCLSVGRAQDDYGWMRLYRKIGSGSAAALAGAMPTPSGNRTVGSNVMTSYNVGNDRYTQLGFGGTYLDSPASTSTLRYSIYGKTTYGSNMFMNTGNFTSNYSYNTVATSQMTLYEVRN